MTIKPTSCTPGLLRGSAYFSHSDWYNPLNTRPYSRANKFVAMHDDASRFHSRGHTSGRARKLAKEVAGDIVRDSERTRMRGHPEGVLMFYPIRDRGEGSPLYTKERGRERRLGIASVATLTLLRPHLWISGWMNRLCPTFRRVGVTYQSASLTFSRNGGSHPFAGCSGIATSASAAAEAAAAWRRRRGRYWLYIYPRK